MKYGLTASLILFFVATGFSAEKPNPFLPGDASFLPDSGQYPAAYNAAAAYDLQQNWTGSVNASFIYWYAAQIGQYLAQYAILDASGSPVSALNSKPIYPSRKYSPGFKVGIGATYQKEWTVSGDYTWFRTETHTGFNAPTNRSAIAGTGVWVVDDWFQQVSVISGSGKSLTGERLTADWKLAMDLGDLSLSRPYYQGSSLTLLPFFGLRGAWIRQNFTVRLFQAPASEGGSANLGPQPIYSHNESHSWAIGPRAGAEARCLLPQGWRLHGRLSGSLLLTTFTKVFHSEDAQSNLVVGPYDILDEDHRALTPNVEMGLGFGWNRYFCQQKYHVDLSASYDFLEFWNENAIRRVLDDFWAGIASPGGDLFLHGLTVSARFDF